MKTILRKSSIIIILLVLFGDVQPVSADVSNLIGLLTGKLGVSEQQAEGGAARRGALDRRAVRGVAGRTATPAVSAQAPQGRMTI